MDGAEGNRRVVVAAAAAAGTTLALMAAGWALVTAIDSYVPYKYHYRPGTFSGWLAKQLNKYSKRRRSKRPVRVYMDGCFDMMHYGHANALRQAKALGDVLVVGLVPDAEILRCKGPPVLVESERYTLVEAVKWVDEIITGVPYDLSPAFMDELFSKHRIDYIIHGDDPCLMPDGTDAYAHPKKLGRFKMIKRTEGVSTTDIVGRMLTCTRVNSSKLEQDEEGHPLTASFSHALESEDDDAEADAAAAASSAANAAAAEAAASAAQPDAGGGGGEGASPSGAPPRSLAAIGGASKRRSLRVRVSRFLPTSRRLVQFSEGKVAPEGATIVYIDGAFDVFHPGHVDILKLAKQQGDFLLVGLHTDEDVAARRGAHLPIMNVHERALSVLACKYVDEVIIGAPAPITDTLLTTFRIDLVVRGSRSETSGVRAVAPERYAIPRQRGLFRELPSPLATTTASIITRIVGNRAAFEARNAKKVASEDKYYSNVDKAFVQEV